MRKFLIIGITIFLLFVCLDSSAQIKIKKHVMPAVSEARIFVPDNTPTEFVLSRTQVAGPRQAIVEPPVLFLFGIGLIGLGAIRRRNVF